MTGSIRLSCSVISLRLFWSSSAQRKFPAISECILRIYRTNSDANSKYGESVEFRKSGTPSLYLYAVKSSDDTTKQRDQVRYLQARFLMPYM